jgi:hypothetical protein
MPVLAPTPIWWEASLNEDQGLGPGLGDPLAEL